MISLKIIFTKTPAAFFSGCKKKFENFWVKFYFRNRVEKGEQLFSVFGYFAGGLLKLSVIQNL